MLKKFLLKIFCNCQENTCVRAPFLIRIDRSCRVATTFITKETLARVLSWEYWETPILKNSCELRLLLLWRLQISRRIQHIHCKHMLLQESFIDRNNEILWFKNQIHNQSSKLNGFIEFMNYLAWRNTSNILIRQHIFP